MRIKHKKKLGRAYFQWLSRDANQFFFHVALYTVLFQRQLTLNAIAVYVTINSGFFTGYLKVKMCGGLKGIEFQGALLIMMDCLYSCCNFKLRN